MELETFKATVLPIQDKLFRFALRIVKSEEEASDIVQEAFIRIWKNVGKMKEVANPEAWCMTVTKNIALDTLKSNKRKNTQKMDEYMHIEDEAPSPGVFTELRDSINSIHLIINELPAKQRQIIHLRDMEGYSYEEISEIMEVPMNQVKVNLFRARNTVRSQFIKMDTYGL